MSVARTDDSALDDDPDFMGQVILEGQGSEALPRKEVVYPLTKKMEHEGWIHTANRSYRNPYNEAVGGTLTIRYSLRSEDHRVVVRDGRKVSEKKTLADSRAPHVSAPPLDLSYCNIASPDDIVAAAARQDPPVPQWSAETMRTLKLRMKKSHTRPKQPRHGFDRSNFTVLSQTIRSNSPLPEPEPEPEPEPGPGQVEAAGEGGADQEQQAAGAEGQATANDGGRISSSRSCSPTEAAARSAPSIHPKLEAVVEDAFVRIFEFLQTEKLTTVHFFHAMDKDNSGTIDADEFTDALQEMGMQLTKAERRLCIAKLDVDGDGSVDLAEFVERMASIRRRQLAGKEVDGLREQADADDPIEVVDGINLKNNLLTQLEGIGPALCPFLLCNLSATLQWLDLSFNQLDTLYGEKIVTKNTTIGKEETLVVTEPLAELQNLAILNLHCNKFTEMKTIAPLAKLTRLEKLTLQGNPMEEGLPNYRPKVLALVPWLRQLDYVTVTAKVRVQCTHVVSGSSRCQLAPVLLQTHLLTCDVRMCYCDVAGQGGSEAASGSGEAEEGCQGGAG